VIQLNAAFHRTIRHASGSPTVIRLIEALQMPTEHQVAYWQIPDRKRTSLAFHRKIAAAFRDNAPVRVRRLIEEHILERRDMLIAGMARGAPG
jgi:DNA-binding GntR family transcriptional regulator